MKVILKKTVSGIGKQNEVKDVSDGYARNYLIPRGLAVEAKTGQLKQLQTVQVAESRRDDWMRDRAEKAAQKLRETTLTIKARTGPDGKLYGSVTAHDIAHRLEEEHKIQVDRRRVDLHDPIKSLGVHTVSIGLLSDLSVDLQIEVVKEN